MRIGAVLVVSAALCSAACTGALFSHYTFQSGPTASAFHGKVSPAPMRLTKADVLARFGAPGDVIPQASGDIFVYRLRQADLEVLNLNPFIVLGLGFSLYARLEGLRKADALYIHFDEHGRVRDVSSASRL